MTDEERDGYEHGYNNTWGDDAAFPSDDFAKGYLRGLLDRTFGKAS